MNIGNNAKIEAAKVLQYTSLSGDTTAVAIGTPLRTQTRGVIISNSLNKDIWISDDSAIPKKILLPSASPFTGLGIAFTQMGLVWAKGVQIYITPDGTHPTSGQIALTPITE